MGRVVLSAVSLDLQLYLEYPIARIIQLIDGFISILPLCCPLLLHPALPFLQDRPLPLLIYLHHRPVLDVEDYGKPPKDNLQLKVQPDSNIHKSQTPLHGGEHLQSGKNNSKSQLPSEMIRQDKHKQATQDRGGMRHRSLDGPAQGQPYQLRYLFLSDLVDDVLEGDLPAVQLDILDALNQLGGYLHPPVLVLIGLGDYLLILPRYHSQLYDSIPSR